MFNSFEIEKCKTVFREKKKIKIIFEKYPK